MSATLCIAQYGHIQLRGARHWALLWMPDSRSAMAFQIEGSTTNYSLKTPQAIISPEKASSFLGMVKVGTAKNESYNTLVRILERVPIVTGDLRWTCQDWIINALNDLKNAGFDVQTFTKQELVAKLG